MRLKKCTACKKIKPTEDFHKDKSRSDGLNTACRPCASDKGRKRYCADPKFHIARGRIWKANNRERHLKTSLEYKRLKVFGISAEDFEVMLSNQKGNCATCGDLLKPAYVDHDHQTGKVRGLLCRTCNVALGMMNDSPEDFERLSEYILKYESL